MDFELENTSLKDDTPKMVLRAGGRYKNPQGDRNQKQNWRKSKNQQVYVPSVWYLREWLDVFPGQLERLTGTTYIFSMVYKKPDMSD